MFKSLFLVFTLIISGCSSVKSTHKYYNIPVKCAGIFTIDNLGNQRYVKVNLTRKIQDRFGVIYYQAKSNLTVKFIGRGLLKEDSLKGVWCE